jgi:multiple antibiotic resistance protein
VSGGQEELFGVVPLGVPLLARPAVFATSLIIYNSLLLWYVLLSLLLNLCVCGIVFRYSHQIVRLVGRRWLEAISKVFSVILASIAIMFIRTGLSSFQLP